MRSSRTPMLDKSRPINQTLSPSPTVTDQHVCIRACAHACACIQCHHDGGLTGLRYASARSRSDRGDLAQHPAGHTGALLPLFSQNGGSCEASQFIILGLQMPCSGCNPAQHSARHWQARSKSSNKITTSRLAPQALLPPFSQGGSVASVEIAPARPAQG